MFKHILVPTDGSDLSRETTRRAVSFAKEAGARITAFYAKPEYPVTYYGEGALIDPTTPEKFAELAEQQAQQVLGQVEEGSMNRARRPKGLGIVGIPSRGDPGGFAIGPLVTPRLVRVSAGGRRAEAEAAVQKLLYELPNITRADVPEGGEELIRKLGRVEWPSSQLSDRFLDFDCVHRPPR